MTSFEPATADEIKKLILSSQDKSCDLDPLPTELLKSCLDILLTPITNTVNLSLESGSFPDVLKVSHITPLLKKPSLSKDDMKNYRPVSNLNFISKIIEKIISNRIWSHLDKNNLSNPNQSAYNPLYSTETALLKIHIDICMNMDTGKTTALVLLDLSAAFDTLDHSSIIELLSGWYSISGTALNWVRSYLSNRVQRVKLLESFKEDYGVPQGSVLIPLLFTLYTTPLSSVISRHNIWHHLYADDTHIYLSLSKTDPEMSLSLVQQCLQDVSDWMIASKLKLNSDKTEFILIGTKAQRDKFKKYFPTKLLDQDVTPTDSARNLGVEFDKDFNFKKHISKVCRCYYHIRDLRRLRRCLTAAVTKTIATSLVSSKLDYCNSILYNIPNREINKVQSVQNCLARVVTRSPRFCSVTPLLKSLHWLPVQFRIKHKICTLTYKVIHSCQPVNLNNLLKPLNRTRRLRSSDDDQLVVPRVSSRMGFFGCGPPSSGIVSLLRLIFYLNLHSHFGRNWRLYISVKPFHPKSSVSRQAGSTNWNVKRTMIIEPHSDLKRLWARDIEDLGALEVFHFIPRLIFFNGLVETRDLNTWRDTSGYQGRCTRANIIWIMLSTQKHILRSELWMFHNDSVHTSSKWQLLILRVRFGFNIKWGPGVEIKAAFLESRRS